LEELELTGLEEVRLTLKSGVCNNDDPLFRAFAAAAVQYCSNLTTLELTEEMEGDDDPRPFKLLPLVPSAAVARGRGWDG